jgi:hypothetical protein
VFLGAAAICAVAAASASAQVIRTRPFPGIFGSGDPAKSVTQVDFLSFIAGGYETATASVDDGRLGSSADDNRFGNLTLSGRVAHQGRRTKFGADAAATTSYYGGVTGMTPFTFSTGATFSGAVGRRGTFSLRQDIFYSPYYALRSLTPESTDGTDPLPERSDESVDPRVDQRATRLSTTGYTSFASAARQAGRNGSLFAAYRFNYIDFAPGVFDLMSHAPRAGYRHRIGRYASLNASYGLQLYEYRASPYGRLTSHDVALGLGYDRPLSAWRRTTVGFHVSTAVVDQGAFTRVHLNANARLHRRFFRTWVTGVTYLRGQQVLDGFTAPFFTFSDSVSASVSGLLGRGIGLSGRASYSRNTYTLDTLSNVFNTLDASVHLQVPVMWALAAYVEGYYAEHDFQRRVGLLERVPTSLERFGTRVGLTVSVPVLR